MVVATYFYYEKVRRTIRTAIVSNLFKEHLKATVSVRLLKSASFLWFKSLLEL